MDPHISRRWRRQLSQPLATVSFGRSAGIVSSGGHRSERTIWREEYDACLGFKVLGASGFAKKTIRCRSLDVMIKGLETLCFVLY